MPGQDLNISLPTPSVTPGPGYASDLNAALQTIIDDIEPKVTPDEIDVNQTVDVNAQLLDDVGAVRLAALAAILSGPSHARKLQCDAAGDLWHVDNNGAPMQITKNGALNAAALKGFTGDYGAGGVTADASYSNATKTFTFLQAVNHAAKLNVGDIELREAVLGVVNKVTLKSPAALAASYSLLLPAAVPAAEKIVTMNAAGQLLVTKDAASPSFTDVKLTGNRVMTIMAGTGWRYAGAGTFSTAFCGVVPGAAGDQWAIGIPLNVGDRIRSILVTYTRVAGTQTFNLRRSDNTTSESSIATVTDSSFVGTTTINLAGIDHTLLADNGYLLRWTCGDVGDRIFKIAVTWDRP